MLLAIALLMSSWTQAVGGQQSTAPVATPTNATKPASPKKPAPKPKLTAQQKQAVDILESAQGMLGHFSAEMQSHLLLAIAQAYRTLDRRKEVELLKQAFAATADMPQGNDRTEQQHYVFLELKKADPDAIAAMQDSPDSRVREMVAHTLTKSDIDQGRWAQATQRLSQWDASMSYPYILAAQLISKLPAEQSGERQAIFSTAVTAYGASADYSLDDGMTELILATREALPAAMVVDAIDLVLDRTAKSWDRHTSTSISGKNGQASFTNMYEYRLFELLPTLDKLDPAKAQILRREHSNIAALMKQYPQGVSSISPENSGRNQTFGGDGRDSTSLAVRVQQERIADTIVESAGEDFLAAIAATKTLINDPGEDYEFTTPRCEALEGIARQAMHKKNFTAATDALKALVSASESLKPLSQANYLVDAAAISAQIDDPQTAKQYLNKTMKIAADLYQQDAFADPPNDACKAVWPSTGVWRAIVVVGARIDPGFALEQAASLPDPEIEAVEKVAIAGAILQERPGFNFLKTSHNGRFEAEALLEIPWWEPSEAQSPPHAAH